MWRGVGVDDAAEQRSAIPSHQEPRSKPTASERERTPSYPLCGAARRAEPALSLRRRRATPFRSAPSTPKSLPDLNGLSIHSRRGNPSGPPHHHTDEACAPTQSQRAGSDLKHGPRVQHLPPTPPPLAAPPPPPQPPPVPPPAPAPAAHRRPARRSLPPSPQANRESAPQRFHTRECMLRVCLLVHVCLRACEVRACACLCVTTTRISRSVSPDRWQTRSFRRSSIRRINRTCRRLGSQKQRSTQRQTGGRASKFDAAAMRRAAKSA